MSCLYTGARAVPLLRRKIRKIPENPENPENFENLENLAGTYFCQVLVKTSTFFDVRHGERQK